MLPDFLTNKTAIFYITYGIRSIQSGRNCNFFKFLL
jgi:hypothetical protein